MRHLTPAVGPGRKSVVIICRHFPPENIVGAFRPKRIALAFANAGYHVGVVTFKPRDGWDLDHADTVTVEGRVTILTLENLPKHVIQRLSRTSRLFLRAHKWVCIHRRIAQVWRLVTSLDTELLAAPAMGELTTLIFDGLPDIILTTSPPHAIHATGLHAVQATHQKWIVDLRDPWDSFTKTLDYRIRNPIRRILEYSCMRRADLVISTTKSYSQVLRDRFPDIQAEKFVTFTNSFEHRDLKPQPRRRTRELFLVHIGILYPEKDPFVFFRMLDKCRNMEIFPGARVTDVVRCVFIGSNNESTRRVIQSLMLEDMVQLRDRVSHRDAVEAAAQADLGLILAGIGPSTRRGWLPSKVFEYIGVRTPILAIAPAGDLAELISEHEAGWILSEENPDALRRVLQEAYRLKFTEEANERPRFQNVSVFEASRVFAGLVQAADALLERSACLASSSGCPDHDHWH